MAPILTSVNLVVRSDLFNTDLLCLVFTYFALEWFCLHINFLFFLTINVSHLLLFFSKPYCQPPSLYKFNLTSLNSISCLVIRILITKHFFVTLQIIDVLAIKCVLLLMKFQQFEEMKECSYSLEATFDFVA